MSSNGMGFPAPMKTFYLTTPLYYVNARPHLGHAYTTVVADCLSRFKKMQGFDVCLLTGTDEHGQNIERAAAAQGLSPKQLADQITAEYQNLWARFGIEYGQFIRTTDSRHYAGAAEVFKRALNSGAIYKGQYSGWYCISCNLFAPESETAPKCEVCERPTERVTEESYFFRLSDFQQRLLDHYEKHPEFIMPLSRRNEVVSFVSGGLKDLSISRTSVKWGIPVPDEQNHVIYVWFDALVGYLTGIGFAPGASCRVVSEILACAGAAGWQRHSSVPHSLLARVSHGRWTGVTQTGVCAWLVAKRRSQNV